MDKLDHGAAATTLLATLLTVEYSNKSYDIWDFVVVMLVGLFIVRRDLSKETDRLVVFMICLSFGVAVVVILSFFYRLVMLAAAMEPTALPSLPTELEEIIGIDFIAAVSIGALYWLFRRSSRSRAVGGR